jgi:dTDP-4-dehydrorhamnose reductase
MLGSVLMRHCDVGTARQEADVCKREQLEEFARRERPTHVINCAAYTDVDGAEEDSEGAFAVNCEGAGNVAAVAREIGARLVHISTDYVFDGKGVRPYREEDMCAPVNVYGKSKWEGEKRVLEVMPGACVLRTSWLFGRRGKNFISSLLGRFREEEELRVVSDQWGKPTYCEDLVNAVMRLLDAEGIVHFANEGGSSRYEIAVRLLEVVKRKGISVKCRKITPVSSAEFPTPAPRPAYSVLDTSKYFSLTSIQPRSWIEAASEFFDEI